MIANKVYVLLSLTFIPLPSFGADPGADFFGNFFQQAAQNAANQAGAAAANAIPSSLTPEQEQKIKEVLGKVTKIMVEGAFTGLADVNATDAQKAVIRDAIITVVQSTLDPTFFKEIGSSMDEFIKFIFERINEAGQESAALFKEGGAIHDTTQAAHGFMTQEGEFARNEVNKMSNFFAEHLEKHSKGVEQAGKRILINNMARAAAVTIGASIVFFVAKNGIPLAARRFEEWLKRPDLIIESSKQESFISRLKKMVGLAPAIPPLQMVFSPALQNRLDDIVKVTKTVNKRIKEGKKNVKYRNLMLWGPPGTGKTMFAKELAVRSGLQWALMSGSSFAKFKEGEGIEELDKLFRWAKRSKGLMIIIDEAEAFLMKRENMDPNSKAYQLLNNFLNYTGQRSDRFMLVFMTNHKDIIDSAMFRRIDDLIELPLPTIPEREQILTLYKNKILMDVKQNGRDFVESVEKFLGHDKIKQIAIVTEGLSSGDLEGIINTLRTDADIRQDGLVSQELVDQVVERAIEKHREFNRSQNQKLKMSHGLAAAAA